MDISRTSRCECSCVTCEADRLGTTLSSSVAKTRAWTGDQTRVPSMTSSAMETALRATEKMWPRSSAAFCGLNRARRGVSCFSMSATAFGAFLRALRSR